LIFHALILCLHRSRGERCSVRRILHPDSGTGTDAYTHAPCNNPFLPDYIRTHDKNITVEVVNSTTVVIAPPVPTFGQLLALRVASKGYVFADALYLIDAALILWNWAEFDRRRRAEWDAWRQRRRRRQSVNQEGQCQ
jgi:hypothetical protein